MTYTALIKIAPIFDPHRLNDETHRKPGRTLYQRGSLTLRGEAPPVLIDHNKDRPIGLIRSLVEVGDTDGDWIAAYCDITDPPCWLERGTRASFALSTYDRSWFGETERVFKALVSEVSVLAPGVKPAEPCAEVWSYRRTEPKPAARVLEPQLLVRPSIGQVLGVR